MLSLLSLLLHSVVVVVDFFFCFLVVAVVVKACGHLSSCCSWDVGRNGHMSLLLPTQVHPCSLGVDGVLLFSLLYSGAAAS